MSLSPRSRCVAAADLDPTARRRRTASMTARETSAYLLARETLRALRARAALSTPLPGGVQRQPERAPPQA
jgi:hypothetical protein